VARRSSSQATAKALATAMRSCPSGGPGDAGAALAAFRAAQERRARQYAAFGSGFQSYLRTRDEAAFRCGGRGAGGACGAPHQRSRSGAALRNPELARQ